MLTVGCMTSPWDLSFSIDAHGHDDTHVGVVPGYGSSAPHLKVRTGLVVVHCLDGAAAMSAARAWAVARLATTHWLPSLYEAERATTPPEAGTGIGAAYPAGSIYFEGRQPWHVEHAGLALSITVGPLQVRVHDATAVDTHIRAWTEASAFATRLFPGKAVPFARLVEHERISALRALDAERERNRPRRNTRAEAPVTQPTRDPRDKGSGRESGRA